MCVCVREDPAKEMNSSDTSPFRMRYRRSVGLRALKGWSLCALSIYVHTQHTQPQSATGDNIMRRPPLYIHPTEGRSTRSDQWRVMTHVHLKVIAYHTYDNIYLLHFAQCWKTENDISSWSLPTLIIMFLSV